MKKGILCVSGAYVIWGLFPIYWKWLHQVPPLQLLCHRILWSCIILTVAILLLRQRKNFIAAIRQPKVLLIYPIAALAISLNWFVYVWAVNAGFIIEASLGYFISPLVSILVGVVLLRERLRLMQWIAIGIASVGVIYLTFVYGALPWVGLILAISFGGYGCIKKIAPLNSFYGLTFETIILLIPVAIYLLYAEQEGVGAWRHINNTTDFLLVGGGIITVIPLLMFSFAARRINLTLVGFLQFISPTLQFLVGKFVYQESFSQTQFIGFGAIWIALIIFSMEGLVVMANRKNYEVKT